MIKVHLSGLSWRARQGYNWGPADASKGIPYVLLLKPSDWRMATYHIFNIKYLSWLYLLLCVWNIPPSRENWKCHIRGGPGLEKTHSGCTGNCKLENERTVVDQERMRSHVRAWTEREAMGTGEASRKQVGREKMMGSWPGAQKHWASGERRALSSEAEQKEQWEESRS